MTKIQAIRKVMEDAGGFATLTQIYREVAIYCPEANTARDWRAGIRGVIYREIRCGRNFIKIQRSTFAIDAHDHEHKWTPLISGDEIEEEACEHCDIIRWCNV